MDGGRRVVVAGAGDVGMRVARLRAAAGDEVFAVRRRVEPGGPEVRMLRGDLATGEGLEQLPRDIDAIVYCAAPDERNDEAYRALYVDGPGRLLDAAPGASRLLFVSSTAVYHQNRGERVDEDSATLPERFNGQRLLEAERMLAARTPGLVVLRLGGLYGPGRTAALTRALSGAGGRARWTNRIHVEDAATALARLVEADRPAPCYLGVDDRPAREDEVFGWMRATAGLPAVASEGGAESGRRADNHRLRAAGWTPRFPDFRRGYRDLFPPPTGR